MLLWTVLTTDPTHRTGERLDQPKTARTERDDSRQGYGFYKGSSLALFSIHGFLLRYIVRKTTVGMRLRRERLRTSPHSPEADEPTPEGKEHECLRQKEGGHSWTFA